jgi:hypothetical protein
MFLPAQQESFTAVAHFLWWAGCRMQLNAKHERTAEDYLAFKKLRDVYN